MERTFPMIFFIQLLHDNDLSYITLFNLIVKIFIT